MKHLEKMERMDSGGVCGGISNFFGKRREVLQKKIGYGILNPKFKK